MKKHIIIAIWHDIIIKINLLSSIIADENLVSE